jgi:hypothetical protein
MLAPAPVPAEGWAAEAEGLAGSGAGGGVVAWAAVASAPVERVLAIRSWILSRGGRQTVGGNRARRWTPTQQPPDSPPSEGVTTEGPLGDEGNAQRLPLPSLSKPDYVTTRLLLLLLLQLLLHATKETKQTESKATKLNQSLRSSLLINVCLFSYKGTSIYRRPWE